MNKSDDIKELATALCFSQSEMENVKKGNLAKGNKFDYTYANLADVLEIIKPALNKHNISVVQFPSFSDGIVSVETLLVHQSGEWMSGTSGSPVEQKDPQSVGKVISYMRRYSLLAVCGIAAEDDDAQKSVKDKDEHQWTKMAIGFKKGNTARNDLIDIIHDLITLNHIPKELVNKSLEWAKVESFDHLTEEQAKKIIKRFEEA